MVLELTVADCSKVSACHSIDNGCHHIAGREGLRSRELCSCADDVTSIGDASRGHNTGDISDGACLHGITRTWHSGLVPQDRLPTGIGSMQEQGMEHACQAMSAYQVQLASCGAVVNSQDCARSDPGSSDCQDSVTTTENDGSNTRSQGARVCNHSGDSRDVCGEGMATVTGQQGQLIGTDRMVNVCCTHCM